MPPLRTSPPPPLLLFPALSPFRFLSSQKLYRVLAGKRRRNRAPDPLFPFLNTEEWCFRIPPFLRRQPHSPLFALCSHMTVRNMSQKGVGGRVVEISGNVVWRNGVEGGLGKTALRPAGGLPGRGRT